MSRPAGHNREADDLFERDRIHYQWMLQSISRFRLFFAGLVFATLSFSVQFAIDSGNTIVNTLQSSAWICLLVTGVLALRDAGGLVSRYT